MNNSNFIDLMNSMFEEELEEYKKRMLIMEIKKAKIF